MFNPANVYVRRGGSGAPTVLLLHGMGGTGDVWTGVIDVLEQRWPGSWIVPDLPGHGRSGRLNKYTYSTMAQAIADALDVHEPLLIMGHSLGGVLAMMLGTGQLGVDVRAVCALGVKPDDWPDEVMSAVAVVAEIPPPSFPTKSDAIDHVVTSIGAAGVMSTAPTDARRWWDSSVNEDGGRWTPSMDSRAYAVGQHDMAELVAHCSADLVLAGGTEDPLCQPHLMRKLQSAAVILPGEGHYPHLRDPNTLWPLLQGLLDR